MNDIDRIIDDALASYSGAEPRAGLERRVTRNIEAAGRGLRWAWSWVAAATAAAVLAMAVVVIWPESAPPRPTAFAMRIPRAELRSLAPVAVTKAPAPRRVRTAPRRPDAVPKQNMFPSPVPLSRDERVVLASVSKYPDSLPNLSSEPIQIKPITIAPLNGAQ